MNSIEQRQEYTQQEPCIRLDMQSIAVLPVMFHLLQQILPTYSPLGPEDL